MEFKFKLNEEESKLAERLGLPTEYEVKPHETEDKVQVWYTENGEDRYGLYKKEVVEEKLNKGVWIKLEESIAPNYKAFYDYFAELYGAGLEVANWHMNGDLEPFDEFFHSAEEEMNK